MPVEITEQFKRCVDELILTMENDPELKGGFQWVDQQSRQNGTDIYTEAFILFQKHLAKTKAKEWLKDKKII